MTQSSRDIVDDLEALIRAGRLRIVRSTPIIINGETLTKVEFEEVSQDLPVMPTS